MSRNKIIFIILVFLLAGYLIIKAVTLPPLLKTAKLIEIPEGANAIEIAKLLKEKGVIKNTKWFLYWTNRYQVQKKLKAGIYEFSGRTCLKKVISKLIKGEVSLVKISIPEGYTINDIGLLLEKKELVEKNAFIQYAREKKLEGFLFPDTYFFPRKVSVEGIASTMFRRFKDVFEDIYGEPINDNNFKKIKEIVTVASILEKEAMYTNERKIIAGIIYKRLKKNMPIQSCATVLYVLERPKTRLSSRDLMINSPYNTYKHKGLPPGPICNPGKDSLQAALNPRTTDYLFFVSMGNGCNHFSKTYKEHQRAMNLFLSSNPQSETPVLN